jgi:protein-S-isoprenylcysteine O-methyltransferase Ste14
MYEGAGLLLGGAALFYGSLALLGYAAIFLFAMHILVVTYEEPTLGRLFGEDYRAYREQVGRWMPRLHPASPKP